MIVEISEKRALAHELVTLERKVEADIAAIDLLKTKMKTIAAVSGSFRETFGDGSTVLVRPSGDPSFKGIMPTLDPVQFLALEKKKQDGHVASGLVRMEPQYSRGANATVTVTLPPKP